MSDILNLLDPITIIKTLGLIGVLVIIFAESGLLIGFFLPGDSLLFTAGFLASQNILDIKVLVIGAFICAVLGDSVGYWFGREVGPKIFNKEDSFFFHKKNVEKAQKFYEKYGNKTIFLARFVPVIRTFAPIVAGVGNMKYRNFISYNIIGGFVWTFGLVFLGYFLGKTIPNVDKFILPIILVIIVLSIIPIIWEIYQSRKENKL